MKHARELIKKDNPVMPLNNLRDKRIKKKDYLLKREPLRKPKPPDSSSKLFNERRKHSRKRKTKQRMLRKKPALRMNYSSRNSREQKPRKM